LRFVLDECMDARVCKAITAHGHECWTVAQAGLDGEDDDEVSVYAADRGAVFVTDDNELIRRRSRLLFGRTLFVRGPKTAAAEIVSTWMDQAVVLLSSTDELIVEVSRERVRIFAPSWLRTP
jgi:predicted nuclease of predicted toxin-antitoxin system